MPVISSPSSVRIWPDQRTLDAAARLWADRKPRRHPELLRLDYFGSYARGDWGVGSDLDLIALVSQDDRSLSVSLAMGLRSNANKRQRIR